MQMPYVGCHRAAEPDIAVSDSTWDEGKVKGEAAQEVQAVVLGTGEPWMQTCDLSRDLIDLRDLSADL